MGATYLEEGTVEVALLRLAVLVSGSGTNLQAVIDAIARGELAAEIAVVVSNRAGVHALERAERAGLVTAVVPLARWRERGLAREDYDRDLARLLESHRPDVIVLAGWMHVLGAGFLDHVRADVINLHPALPGELPGTGAIARALEEARSGARVRTGVMVHRVTSEVDAGPVLGVREVPIEADDDLAALEARVHVAEHALLVEVLGALQRGRSATAPRSALLSVSDKRGLVDFARRLAALGCRLMASGGTARVLAEAGLAPIAVEAMTGFPELLGGRVKTLHPAVHAGVLARRTPEDLDELARHGLAPIDLVVCNLYPFARTLARPGVTHAEAIEQIDIGGVALLRAAAKNHAAVTVVSDPDDYAPLAAVLEAGDELRLARLRRVLAQRAFALTAACDAAIAAWLALGDDGDDDGGGGERAARDMGEAVLPARIELSLERRAVLRYGENPHQAAALYGWAGEGVPFEQLQGKPPSYNNLLDLDAAWALICEHDDAPAVALVKHGNPCGLALGASLLEAWPRALAGDPVSAFGSIVAVNRPVDVALVEAMGSLFVEVVVAPDFAPEALALLARRKKDCRVMRAVERAVVGERVVLRSVLGGVLAQTPDLAGAPRDTWRVATARAPGARERADLELAWRVVKHVKSNAIVLVRDGATVGIGMGQPSRVDAVRHAAARAGERAAGAVMASDAFFPFADGVEAAAAAGVGACIQPGGSVRDEEVIAAADRLGLAMILTAERHFRH